MSLLCQCTIRSGVLNHECLWMRPVLQSGHGVAARHQGLGRETRSGPSDGSQVVAGWKKGRSAFLILAMSPFLLSGQHGADDHLFICRPVLFQQGVVGECIRELGLVE